MAMCSTGTLGMLAAPQGGCSSISQAVEGNTTPPKHLNALAVDSGIGTPINMLRFYSYAPTIINLVLGCSTGNGGISSCANLCFLDFHTLSAGKCYCLVVCGNINTTGQGASSSGYLCLTCNGTCIFGCAGGANTCVGTISKSLTVKAGDNVFMTLYAVTTSCACTGSASACGYISSITPIVGCAGIGSPSGCQVLTA